MVRIRTGLSNKRCPPIKGCPLAARRFEPAQAPCLSEPRHYMAHLCHMKLVNPSLAFALKYRIVSSVSIEIGSATCRSGCVYAPWEPEAAGSRRWPPDTDSFTIRILLAGRRQFASGIGVFGSEEAARP